MSTTQKYRAAELLLRRAARPSELVTGDRVRPQWIDGGARFWYAAGERFHLVDPAAGTREPVEPARIAELAGPPPANPLDVPSPDRTLAVSRRGHDLWARSLTDDREWALTGDGGPDHGYGTGPDATANAALLRKLGLPYLPPAVAWSPDSTKVLTHRTDQRDVRRAHLVEARPADGGPPRTHTQRYAHPGDPAVPLAELVVLDVAAGAVVRAQAEPLVMTSVSPVALGWAWWAADSSAVYYLDRSREPRTLTLHRLDPATGTVTTVLSETGPTRVEPNQWGFEPPIVRVLADEVLWYSQRDGHGHLYRYDLHTGRLLGQVTAGPWTVRRILHVDEAARVVYLLASGLVDGDPYRRTVCRVGLDGAGFTRLTDDDLDHAVTPSPDGSYLVDTASTVDTPPVTTVRDLSGRVLVDLERADITRLVATGWSPPERFRVTAADGVTDLYGVLYRPHGFDPTRRYPVVDTLYPGPQVARVAPGFDPGGLGLDAEPLAALGFVVVALDGRGTPGRGKAFHDAGRIADAGHLDDHVAALRQLAATRPWMDLDRVGAFGHSGGGYAAARAVLEFPEVFAAGVALAGPHDPGVFNAGFVETYGAGDRPSNVDLADRLRGRLLLVHGELDDQVHPQHTLRLAAGLVAADKDFDLLIVPGAEHAFIDCLAYVRKRCWDFLVRELMGTEPPAYRPAAIPIDPAVLAEMFA